MQVKSFLFGCVGLILLSILLPFHVFAHDDVGNMHLLDNAYDPPTGTIYKGEQILFENVSSQKRWPDFSFNASPKYPPEHFAPDTPLATGQTWVYKFDLAGTWQYKDKINPNIHGTIHVIVGKGYSHLLPKASDTSESWFTKLINFFKSII